MNRALALVLLSSTLALAAGCQKHVPPATGRYDGDAAGVEAGAPKPTSALGEPAALAARHFERVHFETDSSALDGSSKAALKDAADILLAHHELRVEVQGHCDERGTTEYNLALGNARAAAVRSTLTAYGVPSGQVATVSFGEERPVASGESETAWSQNRRAEFRILSGAGDVRGSVD